jgi:peptide/nickel transport system substrate-binding protein
LVAGAFFGQATPILGGVVPKWNWGFADINFFKEGADIEGAKKLLAETPSGRVRDLDDHGVFVPGHIACLSSRRTSRCWHQGQHRYLGNPRYWDEVARQVRYHDDVLGSPLADPVTVLITTSVA